MAETSEYVSGLGDGGPTARQGEPRVNLIIPVVVVDGLTPAARATKELILMRGLEHAAATTKMITRLREELGLPALPDPLVVLRWLQWAGPDGRCPACNLAEVPGHDEACDIFVLLTAGDHTCR